MDHHPEVAEQFSNGMDRVAKMNLLLANVDDAALEASFKHARSLRIAKRQSTELKCRRLRSLTGAIAIAVLLTIGIGWKSHEPHGLAIVLDSAPLGMVSLSGGRFALPADNGQRVLEVAPFAIDAELVTVAQYQECEMQGACTKADSTNYWGKGDQDYASIYAMLCNARLPNRLHHPMNCVDYEQASAYCRHVGKRLPTEAEWMIAAGIQHGFKYPWGNEPPAAVRLNACGTECVRWARSHGMRWKIEDGSKSNVSLVPFDGNTSERLFDEDDGHETTSPGRRYPANVYGLWDMAGNLRQWTADTVNKCKDGKCMACQVLKGGSWSDLRPAHVGISWQAFAPQALRSDMHGFRCAMSRSDQTSGTAQHH